MEQTEGEELLKAWEPQMSPSVNHPAPVPGFLISGPFLPHSPSLSESSPANGFEVGLATAWP